MQLNEAVATDLTKLLRRVEGQVGGIIRMLDDRRECQDIVTQLAAASKALDRAGFRLIAAGLRDCMTQAAAGNGDPVDLVAMERLFLALA